MENFTIAELKQIINSHKNINELWRVFIEKNECSPEFTETIHKVVTVNSELITEANEELNMRKGENK